MELLSGKMTRKGQITIPKAIRDQWNVTEGDQFRFVISEDHITIEPVRKNLLSQAIGRITVNDPIDLKKIRKTAHEQMSKEIFAEEIDGNND
jgi:antitoxin PrlF